MEAQETPVVEATFHVDYASYKTFHYWSYMRHRVSFALLIIFTVSLLVFAAVLLWLYFTLFQVHLLALAIGLAACFVSMLVLQLRKPQQVYKKMRAGFEQQTTFRFYEDYFYTVSHTDFLNEGRAAYEAFPFVDETASAFYLQTQEKRYIILAKKFLNEEQVSALRALFQRKLMARFTTYYQE